MVKKTILNVLCTMYYVLCIMYYVQCIMYILKISTFEELKQRLTHMC